MKFEFRWSPGHRETTGNAYPPHTEGKKIGWLHFYLFDGGVDEEAKRGEGDDADYDVGVCGKLKTQN